MWKKEEGASDIVGLEACSSFAIADFYRNLSQFVTDDCSTGREIQNRITVFLCYNHILPCPLDYFSHCGLKLEGNETFI